MSVTHEKFVTEKARKWLAALAIAGVATVPVLGYFLAADASEADEVTIILIVLSFLAHLYGTLLASVLAIWQGFPEWSEKLFSSKLRADLAKTFKATSPVRVGQQRGYKRVFLASVIGGISMALGGLVGSLIGYVLGYCLGILFWPSENKHK